MRASVSEYRETCVVPTPRFARKLSTWNPPSHVEGTYPQSCMVELPRNQVSEMHFDKLPDPSTLQCWTTILKTEVCSWSSFPTDAMLWIKEVEVVESVDDHVTSQSIGRHKFPNFEMRDAKIVSALKEDHHESLLQEESQSGAAKGADARGRLIAHMIAHKAVLDCSHLFSTSLHDDDNQDVDTRWEQALLSTKELPKGSIPESLYKMRIRGSAQLKTGLAMYEQAIHQDPTRPKYQMLKTMVRRHIDQMMSTRIFKVRNERIEGVLIKTQGKQVSVERTEKCDQWKANGCSKRDACSFRHDENKRGQSTRSSSLAAKSQTQNDGRKPSKGSASLTPEAPSGRRYQKAWQKLPQRKLYESVM